jgi:uncharacterized cupredoxin-like copper-binding protein
MVRSRKLMGVTAAVILVPAAFAAAGCGGSSKTTTTTGAAPATTRSPAPETTTTAPATSTGSGPAAVTQTINVDADPSGKLAFVQKALTAKAGMIKFVLRNQASVPHNLAITGNGETYGPTTTISGGQSADLVATLKAGTYEFSCAVPGHKDAGMHGTLTVTS